MVSKQYPHLNRISLDQLTLVFGEKLMLIQEVTPI
jgi:hypothetical protein